MKIFYVALSEIPSRYANSIHVMKMCSSLARENLVTLYVPDKVSAKSDVYKYYGVEDNFKIKKLYWGGMKGRGYLFAFIFMLQCFFKKPDLVYGRCLLACAFSSLIARVPTRYEAHAPVDRYDFIHRLLFKFMHRSKCFDKLIVISEALEDMYKKLGYTGKTLVAHDGADESKFVNDLKSPDKVERYCVGYFGHLYSGRGMEIIVSCAKEMPEVDFLVVGGNNEDVVNWKSCGATSNIIFKGFVEPALVDEYRSKCHVLVAPYQNKVSINNAGDSSKYMSPLKIFEYMSSGVPIVCSDLPVLREVLNEENSVLVPSNNVEAWVSAIRGLIKDQNMCRTLSEKALSDFKEKYTWSGRARDVLL